jgi:hypothetical protein
MDLRAGNRAAATEGNGRILNWSFDGVYPLTNESVSAAPDHINGSVSYGLDPVGNHLADVSFPMRLLDDSSPTARIMLSTDHMIFFKVIGLRNPQNRFHECSDIANAQKIQTVCSTCAQFDPCAEKGLKTQYSQSPERDAENAMIFVSNRLPPSQAEWGCAWMIANPSLT